MNPVIMRMVVDLPAPLGPRKPSTSPRSTPKEMPSTARFAPNVFTRFSILIIGLELRKGGIITQLLPEEKDHEGVNWFPGSGPGYAVGRVPGPAISCQT